MVAGVIEAEKEKIFGFLLQMGTQSGQFVRSGRPDRQTEVSGSWSITSAAVHFLGFFQFFRKIFRKHPVFFHVGLNMGRQGGGQARYEPLLDGGKPQLLNNVLAHLENSGRRMGGDGAVIVLMVIANGFGDRVGDAPFFGQDIPYLAMIGVETVPVPVPSGRALGPQVLDELEKSFLLRLHFDYQANIMQDAAEIGVVAVDGENTLGNHLAADA